MLLITKRASAYVQMHVIPMELLDPDRTETNVNECTLKYVTAGHWMICLPAKKFFLPK